MPLPAHALCSLAAAGTSAKLAPWLPAPSNTVYRRVGLIPAGVSQLTHLFRTIKVGGEPFRPLPELLWTRPGLIPAARCGLHIPRIATITPSYDYKRLEFPCVLPHRLSKLFSARPDATPAHQFLDWPTAFLHDPEKQECRVISYY